MATRDPVPYLSPSVSALAALTTQMKRPAGDEKVMSAASIAVASAELAKLHSLALTPVEASLISVIELLIRSGNIAS
jgi:hypothetical protein